MIKQIFSVKHYWEVVVFYDLDYHLFNIVATEMRNIGADKNDMAEIYNKMRYGKAKAVTYSNTLEHASIVVFNKHKSKKDYINSIVHEAEHVKQAMLQAYKVEDMGESPAYTIGYLIGKMYEVFGSIVCSCNNMETY